MKDMHKPWVGWLIYAWCSWRYGLFVAIRIARDHMTMFYSFPWKSFPSPFSAACRCICLSHMPTSHPRFHLNPSNMSIRTTAKLFKEIHNLDLAIREALLSSIILSTMQNLDSHIVSGALVNRKMKVVNIHSRSIYLKTRKLWWMLRQRKHLTGASSYGNSLLPGKPTKSTTRTLSQNNSRSWRHSVKCQDQHWHQERQQVELPQNFSMLMLI